MIPQIRATAEDATVGLKLGKDAAPRHASKSWSRLWGARLAMLSDCVASAFWVCNAASLADVVSMYASIRRPIPDVRLSSREDAKLA